MGCDIHCYMEFKKVGSNYRDGWPRINPGRHYELFGKLAGVRSNEPAIIEPRGIPDDLSSYAKSDWYLFIDDSVSALDGFCSSAQAALWSDHGKKIIDHNGAPYKIEHPDWHTPSWVSADELEAAMMACSYDVSDEYYAFLAAMRVFEARGNEVRMVFWFDN